MRVKKTIPIRVSIFSPRASPGISNEIAPIADILDNAVFSVFTLYEPFVFPLHKIS